MEKYIVSARKYRPITFESVVGQLHITSTLKNAIVNSQLAHAYLFCGPRGVGKTTCARILAKSINCLNPKNGAEPCGECESCVSFNDSRSFNIHELDAASNNSVNDIRSLTEQVRIPPQVGKYSIYIIDEAHMLSTAAFNAFLKTLEEPPAHAIFILATTEKHKLIPTILSRCQIYDFKRIKSLDLVEYLKYISQKEDVSYDEESLHIISEKADGCMRDALSMYDKVVSFSGSKLDFKKTAESLNVLDYDTYFNFVMYVATGDYQNALLAFDSVLQKGFDSLIFINGLAMHLRNLLVAKTDATNSLLEVTGSVASRFKEQASKCSVNFIFDALSIISNSEYSAKQASSLRLHSEMTILKICNLSPLKLSVGSVDAVYTLPQVVPQTQPQVVQQPQIQQQPQVAQQPQVQPQVGLKPQQMQAPEVQQAPQQVVNVQTAPGQPQIQPQQPLNSDVIKEVSKPKTVRRKSSIGISLKDVVKTSNVTKVEKVEEKIEEETVSVNTAELADNVLASVKEYAKELYKTRPRIAPIFEKSEILNGKITLKVANDIVKEEILIDKHVYLAEIVAKSGVKGLDIEINVMEAEEQKQILPVNDDDKLKYLAGINPEVLKLCKSLSLDFS